MKTPINVLLTAIVYWFVVFAITSVPMYSSNYFVNLTFLTIVIPNMIRMIMSAQRVPQLHINQGFIFTSTVIAFILTYFISQVWEPTDEALRDPRVNNTKKVQLSALLLMTFAAGALITYYTGVDNSIYSNMGW
jgi:D-alanyl-lipoteichoic acid acyltransferase DltB (MBOAT superfamily)